MKNLRTNLSIIFCIMLALVYISNSTPLDSSLDGKVFTDQEGNIYKLESSGVTWAFKYPAEIVEKGDTTVIWEYYGQRP